MAVKNGIAILKQRLSQVAVELFKQNHGIQTVEHNIVFEGDELKLSDGRLPSLLFKDVVLQAYLKQVSLSTTGYYRTPGIFWDKELGKGTPFFYFAYGMAVSEVMVDTLTGHVKLLRADILHDVGKSINTAIDLGQVRGAYIQGVGWVTTEDVKHTDDGRLLNASPDTYKIPVMADIPLDFRVELLEPIDNTGVIHGSKAVGEPPFVLALSVWLAIRQAIGNHHLGIPATNEAILLAMRQSAE
jgi:xanthine dehydrogenase molybdopterin-binding subunit B